MCACERERERERNAFSNEHVFLVAQVTSLKIKLRYSFTYINTWEKMVKNSLVLCSNDMIKGME